VPRSITGIFDWMRAVPTVRLSIAHPIRDVLGPVLWDRRSSNSLTSSCDRLTAPRRAPENGGQHGHGLEQSELNDPKWLATHDANSPLRRPNGQAPDEDHLGRKAHANARNRRDVACFTMVTPDLAPGWGSYPLVTGSRSLFEPSWSSHPRYSTLAPNMPKL
jgi:hypothetical protein